MLHGPGGMVAPCVHADVPDAPTAASAAAARMNSRRVCFLPHAMLSGRLDIVASHCVCEAKAVQRNSIAALASL
jgi:hypothetical protein